MSTKRPLRKWTFRLLLFVVVLWAAVWGVASLLAPRVAEKATEYLAKRLEQQRIGLTEATFRSTSISPWLTKVTLDDCQAHFDLNVRDNVSLGSQLQLQRLQVSLDDVLGLRGSLRAWGVMIELDPADLPPSLPFGQFRRGEVSVLNLPMIRPNEAARAVQQRLTKLLLANEAVSDIQFSGEVKLQVKDVQVMAHLFTEPEGDRFRLRFQGADLQKLAKDLKLDLAPAQLEIVSRHPLRVPKLMLITDRARKLSWSHEPTDRWLRDAHRHVTWSFLLTEQFGPEFAKQVTDAQEQKPGNTANQRAMDFHNNAVGRLLVAENVPGDSLPKVIRQDPRIIRNPKEVPSFGNRLLR